MQDDISLPWFRLYNEIVDNIKIRMISPEYRWYFIAIMACKCQNILKGDPELVQKVLTIKLDVTEEKLAEIKAHLLMVNLIEPDFTPVGWSERQYKSDHSTARTRKFNNKNKNGKEPFKEQPKTVHGTEFELSMNGPDTDTDSDTEAEIKRLIDDLKIDKSLWSDYLSMRKSYKAKNTPRGLRTLLNKIKSYVDQGEEANELIEQAYSNGWKSVFPERKRRSKSAVRSVTDRNW